MLLLQQRCLMIKSCLSPDVCISSAVAIACIHVPIAVIPLRVYLPSPMMIMQCHVTPEQVLRRQPQCGHTQKPPAGIPLHGMLPSHCVGVDAPVQVGKELLGVMCFRAAHWCCCFILDLWAIGGSAHKRWVCSLIYTTLVYIHTPHAPSDLHPAPAPSTRPQIAGKSGWQRRAAWQGRQ